MKFEDALFQNRSNKFLIGLYPSAVRLVYKHFPYPLHQLRPSLSTLLKTRRQSKRFHCSPNRNSNHEEGVLQSLVQPEGLLLGPDHFHHTGNDRAHDAVRHLLVCSERTTHGMVPHGKLLRRVCPHGVRVGKLWTHHIFNSEHSCKCVLWF